MKPFARWVALVLLTRLAAGAAEVRPLSYAAAPPDNPLKGFLPYTGTYTNFPHSLEWFYLPLNAVLIGSNQFDWTPLETRLNAIAARGHHAVFRFYLDYPTLPTGIPPYLLDAGLVTRGYDDHGNHGVSVSPDYENPLLRAALTNFIHHFGAAYDGDPRIGFLTVGLLGFWGEWHTYPYWNPPSNWFASVTVQNEVLDAYQAAFTRTRWLLRQPYGTRPGQRPMGYHDDSFAHSTMDPPAWHFLGALKAAGETNKWRTQPIGGEVRPELQSCLWETNLADCPISAQDFNQCVDATHVTWLLNHGAFAPGFTGAKRERAIAGARRLGYEFHVAQITWAPQPGTVNVSLALRNLGVAPFYYDWPVELAALLDDGSLVRRWSTPWTLRGLAPAPTNSLWNIALPAGEFPEGVFVLALRVVNPLPNGKPLRFANATQDQHRPGWLTLGRFHVLPPVLTATRESETSVRLHITGALPAGARIEISADLRTWQPFQISLPLTNWSQVLPAAALQQRAFFRLVLPAE
jgi:hypothetical protein